MAQFAEDDVEVFPSALSLFEATPLNAAYQKIQYVDYHTTSHLNVGDCLNFLIPGTARQYIDLKRSRLSVKVKIVKEDGSIPQKDEFVAPINLTLHSLFKEMNIQLQQQSVGSFSNQLYAYKAYMEAIRQPYNRQSFLEAQGFYKDTHGSLNETDPVGANEGFKHRFALFRRSIVDLEGPLIADIFQQDRLLINGVEMKISLTQSKDAFCLMSSKGGWKIQILEACVRICKLTPIPAIILAHDDALRIKPATYPFVRTEMKAYQLNTGHYEFNFEDIFQGAVPTQVVCGFVDSTAYNGSYDSNPFLFHHYDINTIALHLDDESIPSKPLKTNFSEGNIMEAYQTLFSENSDQGTAAISRAEFINGFALFTFRIAPDDHSYYMSPVSQGNVRISGTFGKAVPDNVTLILLATFPSVMLIDTKRTVQV